MPLALADVSRLREEVGKLAVVEAALALATPLEEVETRRVQLAMEALDECERLRLQWI
jgi:hypothetical protein